LPIFAPFLEVLMTSPEFDGRIDFARSAPPHILVVDDEHAVRRSIARGLSLEGYEVASAESGEEALEIVERASRRFDVVISDIIMRGMSGVALAERLRLYDERLSVILISGFPGSFLSEDTLPIAYYDFLEKPFSPVQLIARVRATLTRAAAA
jgi:two-component system, OmpR family, response regulator MprA